MKKESEMKEIKIIAVCPSPVILAGLASILSSTPDFRLLETLSDLSELSRKCISKSGADVVILDPAAVPAENLRSIRYSYDCILFDNVGNGLTGIRQCEVSHSTISFDF